MTDDKIREWFKVIDYLGMSNRNGLILGWALWLAGVFLNNHPLLFTAASLFGIAMGFMFYNIYLLWRIKKAKGW